MNHYRAFLLSLCCLCPALGLAGMQSLSDADMGDVLGQDGLAINLEFRINAKADGDPVESSECPTVAGLTGGASCRLAINLADRDGIWIVMKSYRGIIKLTNIRLDASVFGGSTIHRDITTYMGGYDPNNKPAIRLTSGNWANTLGANCELAPASVSCNTYLNTASYTDATVALSIERLTAEFDAGGQPGYLLDAVPGAPLALRLAHGIGLVPDPDNPPDVKVGPYTNAPAQIRLDGRLQVHGFGF